MLTVDSVQGVGNKKNNIALYACISVESKMIRNDQELIQSDHTSCPQNQKGNN